MKSANYNPSKHAPNRQHRIRGVPIDPCLPRNFENTDNEERDPREIEDWWGRAFIVTSRNRHTGEILYVVRRLDGGAWDRSTFIHASPNLMEAIDHARQITIPSGAKYYLDEGLLMKQPKTTKRSSS